MVNDSELRHKLIQEFRQVLTSGESVIPTDTDGVVVLSGPDTITNRARIEFGIDVIKQIIASKLGISTDSVTKENILENSPPLILDATTEHIPEMKAIADSLSFPAEKIQLLDCGKNGVGNTKTQVEVVNDFPLLQNAKHLTFITSSLHSPRVIRTAHANLRPGINFSVLYVRDEKNVPNLIAGVRSEVQRIEQYSAKGDISRDPML